MKFFNLLHFEVESRFNSDENCFWFITKFLDLYHKKSAQLVLKKGQLDTMTYVYITKRVAPILVPSGIASVVS